MQLFIKIQVNQNIIKKFLLYDKDTINEEKS